MPGTDEEIKKGRLFAWMTAFLLMLVTCIPYLRGLSLVGTKAEFAFFSGFNANSFDNCVYLSWMRQAADGHLFQRNFFTTETQGGQQIGLFFLGLGWLARLTHLSLALTYHLARFILGICFLRLVWWLLEMLQLSTRTRYQAYWLVMLSSGFGWIPMFWVRAGGGTSDIWDPESISFLSLYLFPLLVAAQILLVAALGFLLQAEKNQSYRYAIYAGLCGFLLGNIHSYDIITLSLVWSAWLCCQMFTTKKLLLDHWKRALVAGLIALPTTLYQAYIILSDAAMAKRVAVPTLSPPLDNYFLGMGIVFLLMLVALCVKKFPAKRFLLVWVLMQFVAAYLPLPFQRRMILGVHLPLAILAAEALSVLLAPLKKPVFYYVMLTTILFFSSLTNLRILWRDQKAMAENKSPMRSYLYAGEVESLRWIANHTPPDTILQPLPWIDTNQSGDVIPVDATDACFAPALSGRVVNAGHWGETPNFDLQMDRWMKFLNPATSDEKRRALLRETRVKYLLFSQKHDNDIRDKRIKLHVLDPFSAKVPSMLRLIPEASNQDADVYEVVN